MRSPSRGDWQHPRDRGSATAEFALVIPTVLLVLAGCLAGVQCAALQLRLQDAAASAARSASRGDDLTAARQIVPSATLVVSQRSDLVCVLASSSARGAGLLSALTITASSCALGAGG